MSMLRSSTQPSNQGNGYHLPFFVVRYFLVACPDFREKFNPIETERNFSRLLCRQSVQLSQKKNFCILHLIFSISHQMQSFLFFSACYCTFLMNMFQMCSPDEAVRYSASQLLSNSHTCLMACSFTKIEIILEVIITEII